jgi:hypothetical protein
MGYVPVSQGFSAPRLRNDGYLLFSAGECYLQSIGYIAAGAYALNNPRLFLRFDVDFMDWST